MTTFDTNVTPIGFRMPKFPDISRFADAARAIRAAAAKRRAYARVQHLANFHLRDIGLDPADVRRFEDYRPLVHPHAI